MPFTFLDWVLVSKKEYEEITKIWRERDEEGGGRSRRVRRDGGIDIVQSVTECDAKEMGIKRGKDERMEGKRGRNEGVMGQWIGNEREEGKGRRRECTVG